MVSLLHPFMTEELVLSALQEVIDPELGINIVDLGLIYHVNLEEDEKIAVTMTLTTPGCPLHSHFSQEINRVLCRAFPGLPGAIVKLVMDPPWNPDMISPEGRALLGIKTAGDN